MENELKSMISGRVRRHFDQAARTSSPVVWLYAIRAETRIGSANRIRGLFERALRNDSSAQRCIVLWKYYMEFELKQNNLDNAKGIFYRAVRTVPWCKSVWLMSVNYLRLSFTVTELHDILQLMSEKELRIRITPPL